MRKTVSWLVAFTLLLVGSMATTAHAQSYAITPASLDFGCVAAGQTVSLVVNVENTGSQVLGVSVVSVTPATSFSSGFSGTASIAVGSSANITVDYASSGTGSVSGELNILIQFQDGSPNVTETVPLSATCGSSDPAELACDILDYFDASVADGSISGGGYCGWGGVYAMRYKLSAIKYFVGNGYDQYACYMTWCAILKSDGHPWPGDWVNGPGVQSLNDQLVMLKQLLSP